MLQEFLQHLSLELNRSRLTVQAYEADLRGFNDFLLKSGVPTGDTGFFVASAVGTSDVREWMASLSEEGVSTTSIRRKVQSLRAYFKFLMKRGLLSGNPAMAVALPRRQRKLPAIATHSDIESTIEEMSGTQECLIVEMLYGCGLRRAELLGISDNDINPYSRELRILGKGNKHRIIPLPEQLLARISEWQRERDETFPDLPVPRPLFATRRGRMSASTLYLIVKRALKTSSAEKKSPHTLRHSFATQLLNSGADLNSVKGLLGHASLAATQIYTHLAFSELNREWQRAHPRGKEKED